MTSSADDLIDQYIARWESELVLPAAWRQSGSSNAVVSGGDFEIPANGSPGSAPSMSYVFAKDAADYLYTDQADKPSGLTVSEDGLKSDIAEAAQKMNVDIQSTQFFSLLGTDVIVTAIAHDPASVNLDLSPLRDPGALEGACMIIENSEGDPLYMWSYSTGLKTGHGGNPTAEGGIPTLGDDPGMGPYKHG